MFCCVVPVAYCWRFAVRYVVSVACCVDCCVLFVACCVVLVNVC